MLKSEQLAQLLWKFELCVFHVSRPPYLLLIFRKSFLPTEGGYFVRFSSSHFPSIREKFHPLDWDKSCEEDLGKVGLESFQLFSKKNNFLSNEIAWLGDDSPGQAAL
jgi:hypothetical protein